MKTAVIALLIVVAVSLALVSCGVPQEDYDAVLAEKASLQSTYDSLVAEKGVLATELAETKSYLTACQSETEALQNDLSEAQTEAENLESDIGTLTAEKADLESRLEAANAEIKVVDLRHFTDEAELAAWRESVGIIDTGTTYLDSLMELQRIAFGDGYILSIDLDNSDDGWILSLNAFTNDAVYLVFSDETMVYYLADL